ncbi:hypothetical protein CAC42_3399 [Sphaceloma murrayae]|uniref:Rhodopsin domain-containing protein n=1 Tax=Sphaceloma murrayae TaxID=2082308 RepID=A0A2K1R189_9PEZI|nr:hypothetical protein CAC42_3399 [Sphaceloma murrayae]
MAPNPKSFGGNGHSVIRIVVAEFVVTTAILVLRCYTTISIVERVGWDVIWIVAAYLCSVHALAFVILAVRYGMCNRIASVDPTDLPNAILFEWVFNVSSIMSTGFGKFAIGALLLDVQGPTHDKMRRLLYFVLGSTMALAVFMTIFSWFQCSPSDRLWNREVPGTCDMVWPVLYAGVFQGSWSTASDFVLTAYPAYIFWHLETSWQRKLGLCGLFAGGVITGAAAIFKTTNILKLGNPADPTWTVSGLILWASTEMFLIIIMSSIPPLRPLFTQLYRHAKERGVHGSQISCKGNQDASFDHVVELGKLHRGLQPDLADGPDGRSVRKKDGVEEIIFRCVDLHNSEAILITRDTNVSSSEAQSRV